MKTTYVLPLAATLSLALLGACSKPASEAAGDTGVATANAASNAAQDAGNATTDATGPGGVVSPPEANGAVNTDANKTSSDVKPAANSFTESQAKGHIENAGYTEVTGLTKTPDGMWTAKAKKGGKTMNVAIDFKGAVTAK